MCLGFLKNMFCRGIKLDAAELKANPQKALDTLIEGNKRFYQGKAKNPRTCASRLKQAEAEDQGKYAYATVLSCSDSRVPVERIFDAGVMDIFVVRVAGNVCDSLVTSSLEYGVAHVKTPVLMVLGHTKCGAVTAAVNATLDKSSVEGASANIKSLVNLIEPAAHTVDEVDISKEDLINKVIEANIFESLRNFIKNSPESKEIIKSGKVKVVGAVYDIGTGKVNMLPDNIVSDFVNKSL